MNDKFEQMKDVLKQDLQDLAQKRDELKVQIALGSKEVKEEWVKLNTQYQELEEKVKAEGADLKKELEDTVDSMKAKAAEAREKVNEFKNKAGEDLGNVASLLKADFDKLKSKLPSES